VTPVIRNIAVLIPIASPYRIDSNVKLIIQNENISVGPLIKNGQRSVENAIRIKKIYLKFQMFFKQFPIQAIRRVKKRIGKRYNGWLKTNPRVKNSAKQKILVLGSNLCIKLLDGVYKKILT